MRQRTPLRARAWIDTSVLTVLTIIGILGFAPSFGDALYLVAGIGGVLVGTLAALLAAWLRLDILLTAGVAVAAYFVFGSALAMPQQALFGFIPTLETLSGLSTGAVFGWADIVTLSTPVAAPDYIAVLPYVAGWLVGLISATLASRLFVARRRTAITSLLALLAPIAVYVVGVLTGTEEPYFAAARGIAFGLISLVWLAWRVPAGESGTQASKSMVRRRISGIAIVSAAALAIGGVAGFAAQPTEDDRFVLREEIEPPFDPLLYPSPLSGFRQYTKDLVDEPLFTVSGLQEGERIRLVTMDSYDGAVWNVLGPDQFRGGSGSFGLVGRQTQPTALLTNGGTATVDITVEAYSDVWIPGIGYPATISFSDAANIPSTALRYNDSTGIAVLIGGLIEGMTYELDSVLQKSDYTDAELADVPVASVNLPPVSNVPDIVAAKATELAGDAATPIEKLRAIESALRDLGFLSHGSATDAVPSSAGHGADRMKLLLEKTQWIGDDEQYASVFALMARSLGYPARVVMGFAPSATGTDVEVTGDDVSAWVEVAFEGVGWIPFYPTPDETEIPQAETPKPRTEPQPQVRQPPRNDAKQDDLVSAVELENPEDTEPGFSIPGWVWTVVTIIAVPAALYFVPLLVVAFIKRRRRASRRNAAEPDRQAAGAWDELVDTYAELGYRASRTATRVQLALGFEDQFRQEIEARQDERADAASRVEAKAARAAAKAAVAEGAPSGAAKRLTSAIDATVVRARETATWRPGVEDARVPLPAIPGLREYAVRADEAVFSGREISGDEVGALWASFEESEDAARRSVSWSRKQLSKFRIRPKRDLAEALASRIGDAVARPIRGAVSP